MPKFNRRKELMDAAKDGVLRLLETTRGAHMFGAGARVMDSTNEGFAVVTANDDRYYVDCTAL